MRNLKFLLVTASFLPIIQVMQVIQAGQEPATLTQRAAAAVAQQLYSELDKKSYQDILKSLSELPIPQELKEPIIAKLNEIIVAAKAQELIQPIKSKLNEYYKTHPVPLDPQGALTPPLRPLMAKIMAKLRTDVNQQSYDEIQNQIAQSDYTKELKKQILQAVARELGIYFNEEKEYA